MKFFLLLFLIQTQAFALNQTFLRMPQNQAYMNFSMEKYLNWHRKKFLFPEKSPVLDTLIGKIDHWIIETPYLRQLTLNHYLDDSGKIAYRIRIFVHPTLRHLKDFSGKGLPVKKELMFVEWDNTGNFCQIFRESKKSFSSWCRKDKTGNYSAAWTETISNKLPQGWNVPFPVLGEEVILKEMSGIVQEILFFEVTPHPSLIPKNLLNSVFLHTKETLFPLDRMSNTRDGKIGLHYP